VIVVNFVSCSACIYTFTRPEKNTRIWGQNLQ